MDEGYNDVVEAKQKEQQAVELRNQEFYSKDNPVVVNDLEAAARELDSDAANLRQAADNVAAEANTEEVSE